MSDESITFEGGFLVFGKKNLSLENFSKFFPSLNDVYLKQVHGIELRVVGKTDRACIGEGDGMWTRSPGQALVIQSADCLPLIFYSSLGLVGAVHAGWRGVAQNIAGHFVARLRKDGIPPESLRCWIGPHIQKASFQVQEPVLRQLVSPEQTQFFHPGDGAFYVDLQKIAESQLRAAGMTLKNIHLSEEDTVTNKLYYSYRACGRAQKSLAPTERNLSFVVLHEKL